MIRDLLLGLGLVAVIEGLVLALVPLRLKDILEFLARTSVEQRRILGLISMTMGVALVWFARSGFFTAA